MAAYNSCVRDRPAAETGLKPLFQCSFISLTGTAEFPCRSIANTFTLPAMPPRAQSLALVLERFPSKMLQFPAGERIGPDRISIEKKVGEEF